ncbi:hypothetical protein EBN88_05490 [Streptomyces triticirhizae]|uniref:Uncharacterized protein n=1 Tax=Streptomyces triticirhizae TaxID=2483353 RepID=A0A3M2M7E4_9ACTN|nr:hypothetical protein EBN88_05490 [Streptomyces triticirhizae]
MPCTVAPVDDDLAHLLAHTWGPDGWAWTRAGVDPVPEDRELDDDLDPFALLPPYVETVDGSRGWADAAARTPHGLRLAYLLRTSSSARRLLWLAICGAAEPTPELLAVQDRAARALLRIRDVAWLRLLANCLVLCVAICCMICERLAAKDDAQAAVPPPWTLWPPPRLPVVVHVLTRCVLTAAPPVGAAGSARA